MTTTEQRCRIVPDKSGAPMEAFCLNGPIGSPIKIGLVGQYICAMEAEKGPKFQTKTDLLPDRIHDNIKQ